MQTIKLIPLGNISIIGNYRDVAPPKETDADIIELSKSIVKDGVMQAILVRPSVKKKDHYEVVFGHRRLLASRVANQANIPASIKNVADDDILELQVTENMNRKDVHPIDEAVAYKSLMQKKKWTVQEIADRFAKKPDYITQRLKLNDLITDLQKDFKYDRMLLGHALLLCRLTPADQKKAKEDANGNDFRNLSVAELKEWIDDDVMQDLSKVPWRLDDGLLTNAGACSVCPKRSGAGNLLFTDMVEDNRCFDSTCFEKKMAVTTVIKLKNILETEPEVRILQYNRNTKLDPEIATAVKEMKVVILYEGSDFYSSSYGQYGIKAKGFYLDGYNKGKIMPVYLKGKTTAKKTNAAGEIIADAKTIIAGIQQRSKRAAELDAEKVHTRILEDLKKHHTQTELDAKMKAMPEPEHVAMMYIIFQELCWKTRERITRMLGIKGVSGSSSADNAAKLYQSLRDLSTGELALMVRNIMMDKHQGSSTASSSGYIVRKMAESYKNIPVQQYETEQEAIRNKRELNARNRIAELNGAKNKIGSLRKEIKKKSNKTASPAKKIARAKKKAA